MPSEHAGLAHERSQEGREIARLGLESLRSTSKLIDVDYSPPAAH